MFWHVKFRRKSFKAADVSILDIMTVPEVNEAAKGAGGRPVLHVSGSLLALNLPMFGDAK